MGGGECYKQRFYPCSVSLTTIEMCHANLIVQKFVGYKFFRIFPKIRKMYWIFQLSIREKSNFLIARCVWTFVFKVFD